MGSAIRKGDYKLMKFYDTNEVELYNLKNDIGENQNLLSSQPQKAEELRTELEAWLKKVGAQYPRAKKDIKDGELLGHRN